MNPFPNTKVPETCPQNVSFVANERKMQRGQRPIRDMASIFILYIPSCSGFCQPSSIIGNALIYSFNKIPMKTGFEPAIDSFTAVRYGSPTACLNIMDVFLYIYVKYVCIVYT